MWEASSIWFDLFVFTAFLLLGHIFFGHFEERTPKWRKLVKAVLVIAVYTAISLFLGRGVALVVLGLSIVPVVFIHGIVLPRKGINGWTSEPKAKYYAMRGWSTDIFGENHGGKKENAQASRSAGTTAENPR